jgi:hypothetical protein
MPPLAVTFVRVQVLSVPVMTLLDRRAPDGGHPVKWVFPARPGGCPVRQPRCFHWRSSSSARTRISVRVAATTGPPTPSAAPWLGSAQNSGTSVHHIHTPCLCPFHSPRLAPPASLSRSRTTLPLKKASVGEGLVTEAKWVQLLSLLTKRLQGGRHPRAAASHAGPG